MKLSRINAALLTDEQNLDLVVIRLLRLHSLPIYGWSGGGDGGISGVFVALGAAFDAGGSELGVEFGGVAAVEVLHHGVEAGDFLAAFEQEDADAIGAFEALEVAGEVGGVFAVDGVAVCAEVLDEVVWDELADELGAEGGFFGESGGGVLRDVRGL